eukprot:3424585-Alexandrium_andersonii.AAC.1
MSPEGRNPSSRLLPQSGLEAPQSLPGGPQSRPEDHVEGLGDVAVPEGVGEVAVRVPQSVPGGPQSSSAVPTR